MASVTGPMMSFDASGTIGGAVTFGKWKGRNYVRRHAIPSNPKSAGQLATRAMMRFLTTQYAGLSDPIKAEWLALAASDNITAMNAYIRFNMKRWTQDQFPKMSPTIVSTTLPVLGALTVTGGVGQLTIAQAVTTLGDGWPLQVVASLTTGFTPVRTDTRYFAEMIAGSVSVVLTGLAPNTYYVRTRAGTEDAAGITAYVAQQAGVVT